MHSSIFLHCMIYSIHLIRSIGAQTSFIYNETINRYSYKLLEFFQCTFKTSMLWQTQLGLSKTGFLVSRQNIKMKLKQSIFIETILKGVKEITKNYFILTLVISQIIVPQCEYFFSSNCSFTNCEKFWRKYTLKIPFIVTSR